MINKSTNFVENICLWNGDESTWTPSADYLMLEQSVTPAKVWRLNSDKTEYEIQIVDGDAQIGFTWNGTYAITNEKKPEPPSISLV